MNRKRIPWLGLIALGLLALAVAGLMQLPTVQQQALLQSLQSLLVWLPVLYGVVGLSYAGRYWRWRLLLGKLGIGSTNWPDWLGWFRGFALTATPAKVGELSRVQLLHEQLGYPRLPLVHVFVAERFSDAAAVALLLLMLIPNQLLSMIPSLSSAWPLAMAHGEACGHLPKKKNWKVLPANPFFFFCGFQAPRRLAGAQPPEPACSRLSQAALAGVSQPQLETAS